MFLFLLLAILLVLLVGLIADMKSKRTLYYGQTIVCKKCGSVMNLRYPKRPCTWCREFPN